VKKIGMWWRVGDGVGATEEPKLFPKLYPKSSGDRVGI
jgi:hypothetical protein